MTRVVHFTDDSHKRGLAWVRKMALLTGDVEAEELLEHLELDRPPAGLVREVVPVPQSIRADLEAEHMRRLQQRFLKGERVHRLRVVGQDQAIREASER